MKESLVIDVKNFIKRYHKLTVEVNDLKITNQITLLVGSNGCGKSTLLKAIAGLIKYNGSITINKSFSYMPEEVYFPKDVLLLDFLNCHQLIHGYDQSKLMDLVFYFNLDEKLNSNIDSLSKGMQVKVNLITALSIEKEVYMLDEPFIGLDKLSVEKLLKYINGSDKYYIITSHQQSLYKNIEGHVISL